MSGYNPEDFGPYEDIHINPAKLSYLLDKHLNPIKSPYVIDGQLLFIVFSKLFLTGLSQELNLHYRAEAKGHIDHITKRLETQLLGANKANNWLGLRLDCVENELDAAHEEISRLKELLNV